jgi:RNA polymerase-binding transcription factor DksA
MAPTTDVRSTPTAELTAVRAVLTAKRAQLAASVVAEPPGDLDGIAGTRGETEHLSVSEQRDVDLAIGSMHRKALHDIEQALARLDDGSYGLCVACRAPIPPERLEAIPEAAVCVRCG